MSTTYNYSVSGDFPSAKVDNDRLHQEILASSIAQTLESIITIADDCDITFDVSLSGAE